MKILAIVGSLRSNSYNKQLAEYVMNLSKDRGVEFEILDYTRVPLFNEDLESPELPEVGEVRQKVREADGIWIFTPEYNHFFSGVLKNLLDWLSRPVGDEGQVLAGKPIAISGAGLGMAGTSHAQDHLMTLLSILNTKIMTSPKVTLPRANEMADEAGNLDLEGNKRLQDQVDSFIEFVEKYRD